MSNLRNTFALVTGGAVLGAVLTMSVSAVAEREASAPLPLNELRTFAEVFGRIKQDYVEPVEDKKLINEAINGMLTGLDPHSAYLDPEAYKELREGTQGVPRSTYCFRHTYATLRLQEGVDVYFLAEQMGTSVKMIEKHYGHLRNEVSSQALEKLSL